MVWCAMNNQLPLGYRIYPYYGNDWVGVTVSLLSNIDNHDLPKFYYGRNGARLRGTAEEAMYDWKTSEEATQLVAALRALWLQD